MPNVYLVVTCLERKAPEEHPVIGEHLVIADSLEQILAEIPANRDAKDFIHSRITKIELLASSTSSAAPMSYLDLRDGNNVEQTDQGGDEAPAIH